MTKVFLGGSRKLNHLNRAIRERTDNIVVKGYEVLIGDANGADKAMQKYLADKRYKNVIVFCMSGTCRNNPGNRQTKAVASNSNKKDFDYFAAKDREMSEQADYGCKCPRSVETCLTMCTGRQFRCAPLPPVSLAVGASLEWRTCVSLTSRVSLRHVDHYSQACHCRERT
jgi:hypothetical protein